MRFLVTLLLLTTSVLANAGEVVLLTSLELCKAKTEKIERKFRKAFSKSELKIVVHHRTDPKTLYAVLTSPETEGVIWVSHAAAEKSVKPGMSAAETIRDVYANDVKNFFTLVPPNLRFLAIVGCESKKIIDGFRSRGHFSDRADLEILSFEKKVVLERAFHKSIEFATVSLDRPRFEREEVSFSTIDISLTRSTSGNLEGFASGWVEMGDQVLGYFVEGSPEMIQASVSEAFFQGLERKNMKFIRDQSAMKNDRNLGLLQIESQSKVGSWRIFAKGERAIGNRNEQLYIYRRQ